MRFMLIPACRNMNYQLPFMSPGNNATNIFPQQGLSSTNGQLENPGVSNPVDDRQCLFCIKFSRVIISMSSYIAVRTIQVALKGNCPMNSFRCANKLG